MSLEKNFAPDEEALIVGHWVGDIIGNDPDEDLVDWIARKTIQVVEKVQYNENGAEVTLVLADKRRLKPSQPHMVMTAKFNVYQGKYELIADSPRCRDAEEVQEKMKQYRQRELEKAESIKQTSPQDIQKNYIQVTRRRMGLAIFGSAAVGALLTLITLIWAGKLDKLIGSTANVPGTKKLASGQLPLEIRSPAQLEPESKPGPYVKFDPDTEQEAKKRGVEISPEKSMIRFLRQKGEAFALAISEEDTVHVCAADDLLVVEVNRQDITPTGIYRILVDSDGQVQMYREIAKTSLLKSPDQGRKQQVRVNSIDVNGKPTTVSVFPVTETLSRETTGQRQLIEQEYFFVVNNRGFGRQEAEERTIANQQEDIGDHFANRVFAQTFGLGNFIRAKGLPRISFQQTAENENKTVTGVKVFYVIEK